MKSRWRRTEETNFSGGAWRFDYRDDSYEPGDWCCLYLDDTMDVGRGVRVRYYYDGENHDFYPHEFVPEVIELLSRYWAHGKAPLELLADCAE